MLSPRGCGTDWHSVGSLLLVLLYIQMYEYVAYVGTRTISYVMMIYMYVIRGTCTVESQCF